MIKPIVPDMDQQARLEVGAQVLAYADMVVGPGPAVVAGLSRANAERLTIEAFGLTGGLKQEGNFSLGRVQVADGGYRSNYALKASFATGKTIQAQFAEAGSQNPIDRLMSVLGVSFVKLELKYEPALFESPHGKWSFAEQDMVAGVPMDATIELEDLTFAGVDNVESVVIYRVDIDSGVLTLEDELTRTSTGQTRYVWSFVPDEFDVANPPTFAAFVRTFFLPGIDLEIADDSRLTPGRYKLLFGHYDFSRATSTHPGYSLYTINSDGTDAVEIASPEEAPYPDPVYFSWSGDGSNIWWGTGSIYKANADGSGKVRGIPRPDIHPSPPRAVNTSLILIMKALFASTRTARTQRISRQRLDRDRFIHWPGRRMTQRLLSVRSTPVGVVTMDASGVNRATIVSDSRIERIDSIAWSPAGDRLALVARIGSDLRLYVVPTDQGPQSLGNPVSGSLRLGYLTRPVFDQSGAIVSFPAQGGVWKVNTDGTQLRQAAVIDGEYARLSPNGSRLAYTKGGTLYVAAADGTRSTVILNHPEDLILGPLWQP